MGKLSLRVKSDLVSTSSYFLSNFIDNSSLFSFFAATSSLSKDNWDNLTSMASENGVTEVTDVILLLAREQDGTHYQ